MFIAIKGYDYQNKRNFVEYPTTNIESLQHFLFLCSVDKSPIMGAFFYFTIQMEFKFAFPSFLLNCFEPFAFVIYYFFFYIPSAMTNFYCFFYRKNFQKKNVKIQKFFIWEIFAFVVQLLVLDFSFFIALLTKNFNVSKYWYA